MAPTVRFSKTAMRFFFYLFLLFSLVLNHSFAATQLPQVTSLHPCNGFDFPVGPSDGHDFYKSRGFITGVHLGEDWISNQGSHHSLGKPIYSIAEGKVMMARDIHVAWGNVVITRHAYLEGGKIKFVDALYGHLDHIDVKEGESVSRGQKIATMGNNHGMYPAHLHFELHKDLRIGVNHTGFVRTLLSYWIPSDFIAKRRKLPTNTHTIPIPVTHFDIPILWKHFSKKKCSQKKETHHRSTKTHHANHHSAV